MGSIIGDIENVVTGNKRKDRQAAIDQANADRALQMQMWERQFGGVSDAYKGRVQEALTPQWEEQFKRDLYQSAGVGAKMGEQTALEALKQKASANPRAMSGSAFTQGTKDIRKQTGDSTAGAYSQARTQAKMAPFNIGASFMGRTPWTPQTNWMPGYGTYGQPELARLAGGGLGQLIKGGRSAYDSTFGSRDYGGDFTGRGDDGVTGMDWYPSPIEDPMDKW
jgi:hypothetical protein